MVSALYYTNICAEPQVVKIDEWLAYKLLDLKSNKEVEAYQLGNPKFDEMFQYRVYANPKSEEPIVRYLKTEVQGFARYYGLRGNLLVFGWIDGCVNPISEDELPEINKWLLTRL